MPRPLESPRFDYTGNPRLSSEPSGLHIRAQLPSASQRIGVRTKYFPEDLILKDQQPPLCLEGESPSFAAVGDNRADNGVIGKEFRSTG